MTKKSLKFERRVAGHKNKALGVFFDKDKVYLFQSVKKDKHCIQIDRSVDGFDFNLYESCGDILIDKGEKEETKNLSDFRITKVNQNYFLTYKLVSKTANYLAGAFSTDLIHWEKIGRISTPAETGTLVPKYKFEDKFVLYFGEESPLVAASFNLKSWEILGGPFTQLKKDHSHIKIADVEATSEGLLLIYYQYNDDGKSSRDLRLKAALFDRLNPAKLLWDKVVWEQKDKWDKPAYPFAAILVGNELFCYWQNRDASVFALVFPYIKSILAQTKPVFISPIINKFRDNPILKPIVHHFWESKAVFNPTAFYDKGEIHLVYRAVGDDDVSVLGYAKSRDGITIHARHDDPIYVPTEPFEGNSHRQGEHHSYSPFVSGPGCGGCEDPRITKIEGRYYMVYVAFDGGSPPRLALTSIAEEDFHDHHWNWEKPVLISKPGEVNKNGCILPEKINGKYVIFHRVYPNILIDFVESLNFDGETFLKGEYRIEPREDSWDSRKVGVGPAPIKTKDGWLVIYSAVDDKDDRRYKVGAMLLDLRDPTSVLYRSSSAILEPTEHYENYGFKYGVVYPCGAVTIDDNLFIYYGASDNTVCVATASLGKFLQELKESDLTQRYLH